MSGWWTRGRERVEFAVFRIVAAFMSALPLEAASAFSGWGWRVIAPLLSRHQRALDNLALAFPEASLAERERLARAMWESLGRTFAEFFHMPQILREQRIDVDASGFEAIANGPPFVVCAPHLGNWEIISQAALRFGLPVAGTYQALTNPLVDAWILEKRKPMYPGGLFSKSASSARAMLRLARGGGYPAFVADLRERNGVPSIFFGRRAMSNPFPAIIARTVGAPMYAACIVRKPGVRFELRIEPVEVPCTDDRDADVRNATQGVQSRFEKFVRDAPEQWMWAHRRWD